MSSSTSIGRGPAHGGNENHDGDPRHTTQGEGAPQDEAPAGSDVPDQAAPEGVKGGKAKGPQSFPEGPGADEK